MKKEIQILIKNEISVKFNKYEYIKISNNNKFKNKAKSINFT